MLPLRVLDLLEKPVEERVGEEKRISSACRVFPFINDFDQAAQSELCVHLRLENFAAAATIYHRGDKANALFLVLSGRVTLFGSESQKRNYEARASSRRRSSRFGADVRNVGEGGVIGVDGVVGAQFPRRESAVAAEESVLLALDRDALIDAFECAADAPTLEVNLEKLLETEADKRSLGHVCRIMNRVGKLEFFFQFDVDTRIELCRTCTLKALADAATLLVQKDVLYVVVSGAVEIRKGSPPRRLQRSHTKRKTSAAPSSDQKLLGSSADSVGSPTGKMGKETKHWDALRRITNSTTAVKQIRAGDALALASMPPVLVHEEGCEALALEATTLLFFGSREYRRLVYPQLAQIQWLLGTFVRALRKPLEQRQPEEANTVITSVQSLPIASKLPLSVCLLISLNMHLRDFARGEVVVKEGDPGSTFFLMLKGRIAIHVKGAKRDADDHTGRRLSSATAQYGPQVASMGFGDSFGEQALASGRSRSATACATVRVVCLEFSKNAFVALEKGRLLSAPKRARQTLLKDPKDRTSTDIEYASQLCRSLRFFEDMGEELLQSVVQVASLVKVAEDEIVLLRGEAPRSIFVLFSGSVGGRCPSILSTSRLEEESFDFMQGDLLSFLVRSPTIREDSFEEARASPAALFRTAQSHTVFARSTAEVLNVPLASLKCDVSALEAHLLRRSALHVLSKPHICRTTPEIDCLATFLRSLPFFQQFERQIVERLAGEVRLRSLRPNEMILRQGARDGDMYVILSGSAQVRVKGKDKYGGNAPSTAGLPLETQAAGDEKDRLVRVLGAGDAFGEASIQNDTGSTASVLCANEPAEMICITRTCYKVVLKKLSFKVLSGKSKRGRARIEVGKAGSEEERGTERLLARRLFQDVRQLQNAAPTLLEHLAGVMTPVDLPEGALLFRTGEQASSVFLLVEGTVAIVDRGRKVIHQCLPGGVIGAVDIVFGGQEFLFNAKTQTPCITLRMSRGTYLRDWAGQVDPEEAKRLSFIRDLPLLEGQASLSERATVALRAAAMSVARKSVVKFGEEEAKDCIVVYSGALNLRMDCRHLDTGLGARAQRSSRGSVMRPVLQLGRESALVDLYSLHDDVPSGIHLDLQAAQSSVLLLLPTELFSQQTLDALATKTRSLVLRLKEVVERGKRARRSGNGRGDRSNQERHGKRSGASPPAEDGPFKANRGSELLWRKAQFGSVDAETAAAHLRELKRCSQKRQRDLLPAPEPQPAGQRQGQVVPFAIENRGSSFSLLASSKSAKKSSSHTSSYTLTTTCSSSVASRTLAGKTLASKTLAANTLASRTLASKTLSRTTKVESGASRAPPSRRRHTIHVPTAYFRSGVSTIRNYMNRFNRDAP